MNWIEADVTQVPFERSFAVWHDRAVFHFLVDAADRGRYVDGLEAAVRPRAAMSSWPPSASTVRRQCSGLPVQRYSSESMSLALGPGFQAVAFEEEGHLTPSGVTQHFLYGHFRRNEANSSG